MNLTDFLSPRFWQFVRDFGPAFAFIGTSLVFAVRFNHHRQRPITRFPRPMLDAAFQFHPHELRQHQQRGTISKAELNRAMIRTHAQIVRELSRR